MSSGLVKEPEEGAMQELVIGKELESNLDFKLPLDSAGQTFAILGIRGAGKSTTAAVMAEEMCKASLPWIALDPVGTWWGMRATADGKPSHFPVVVLGGLKGDLPIEKDSGRKIAEALISERVFAVVDLSQESKATWRKFVTEFSLALMEMNPDTPRHIFIEEAPEFCPQRTKVAITAQCKEAVERLIRLGRNRGYGATLISQRPATVDKDVLSQCENLFVLRTVGAHDRKALKEWLGEKQVGDESFLGKLDSLADGEGFFWSPAWQRVFYRIKVRQRMTYHPGATRKVGVIAKAVAMSDVAGFVEKVRRQLTRKSVPVAKKDAPQMTLYEGHPSMNAGTAIPSVVNEPAFVALAKDNKRLELENAELKKTLSTLNEKIRFCESRLSVFEGKFSAVEKLKGFFAPEYRALKALFEDVQIDHGSNGSGNPIVYMPWLEKAGGGTRRKMLEVVLERKELTRAQLSTLSGCSIRSSGFKNNLSWMRVNRLVDTEGEVVKLMPV